jgi:hypothetical protein
MLTRANRFAGDNEAAQLEAVIAVYTYTHIYVCALRLVVWYGIHMLYNVWLPFAEAGLLLFDISDLETTVLRAAALEESRRRRYICIYAYIRICRYGCM